MSFSTQLWNKYYTDALASLYNPFVTGLANGNLLQAAFVEYIQQDSFYLDVYEKAYRRAAELAHAEGREDFESQFLDLISGIINEKEKHQQRATQRGEKIEQSSILRATKNYTDLLMKASTEGSLVDIVCAICPCSKLYAFIGAEISKAIPDHHHTYSEWINTYADAEMNTSVCALETMIDSLVTDELKESAEFYYAEAMRLEFEFFLQQNHIAAVPTTKIFSVAAGCVCCGTEVECTHESNGTADKDGLCAYIQTLPKCKCECCDEMKMWDERVREMSVDYGKTVVDLQNFEESEEVSCGYGCFTQLPQLLKTNLPVLVAPSASEIHAVESYGLKVRRLFTVMATELSDLPKDTVYFVDHIFEIGMALMGTAFYPNQHFDTLPTTLIIAGSDSGGGAGMQADMKTCCALGSFSVTVFTAITAQNTKGAQNIHLLPLDWIETQIDSVMRDFKIDCVKTGMLGSKEIAALVARKMKEYNVKTFVCDPCMVCRSGNKIMSEDAVPVVKSELIPQALIITPNFYEAETLLGRSIPHTIEGIKEAARELHALGSPYVYIKGGPIEDKDKACDVLCYGEDECELFMVPYILSRNTHGTGCTIASSIAALLSRGLPVAEAVREAKKYVNGAVQASRYLHLGKGKQGPLNHLYRMFPCEEH